MNRAQAKRLAMWTTGIYLLLTDTTGLDDEAADALTQADCERVQNAICEIGRAMLARSGIPRDLSSTEAIAFLATLHPKDKP